MLKASGQILAKHGNQTVWFPCLQNVKCTDRNYRFCCRSIRIKEKGIFSSLRIIQFSFWGWGRYSYSLDQNAMHQQEDSLHLTNIVCLLQLADTFFLIVLFCTELNSIFGLYFYIYIPHSLISMQSANCWNQREMVIPFIWMFWPLKLFSRETLLHNVCLS